MKNKGVSRIESLWDIVKTSRTVSYEDHRIVTDCKLTQEDLYHNITSGTSHSTPRQGASNLKKDFSRRPTQFPATHIHYISEVLGKRLQSPRFLSQQDAKGEMHVT